jgi:hypothetical protein
MRGKKPSAVVGAERIEPRAPQLLVEVRAHASRFRTTRNPPPTNLPQASHADARAHREPYLPFDQLDEDDALPVDRDRHVRPMKTCRDHFSAAQALETGKAVRREPSESGPFACAMRVSRSSTARSPLAAKRAGTFAECSDEIASLLEGFFCNAGERAVDHGKTSSA